jgi:hypothetical protein
MDQDMVAKVLASLQNLETAVTKQNTDFNNFRTEEFSVVQTKLDKAMQMYDERFVAVEGAQKRTDEKVETMDKDVKKIQKGQEVMLKNMADFHARLKTVEQFQDSQKNRPDPVPQPALPEQSEWKAKEYKAFLTSELVRIEAYERENATFLNVVVVGPKPKREPCTQTEIEDYLKKEKIPSAAYQVFPRGKNGVHAVVFYHIESTRTSAAVAAEALAVTFKDEFPKFYSNSWATIDQNRVLREGRKRARDFGDAYKKKYPTTWWRINDNFLLVDDVVVAPVTLIPGKMHWGSLAAKISTARKEQSRKLSFETRLATQVNLRTFVHCVKIYRTPAFLEDDADSIITETVDDEEDLDLGDEDEVMPTVPPSRGRN